MITFYESTRSCDGSKVQVALLDEERVLIRILGGRDDVEFTCSQDTVHAIMVNYRECLERRDRMIRPQDDS